MAHAHVPTAAVTAATPTPQPSHATPRDDEANAALNALCSVMSDCINVAGESLLASMRASGAVNPEAKVGIFLAALTPRITEETRKLVSFTRDYVLVPSTPPVAAAAVSSTAPALDSVNKPDDLLGNDNNNLDKNINITYPEDTNDNHDSGTDSSPSADVDALLESLASTNRTLAALQKLQTKTHAQHTALRNLYDNIPPELPSSLERVSQIIRSAQSDLAESANLLSTLYPPSPPLPTRSSRQQHIAAQRHQPTVVSTHLPVASISATATTAAASSTTDAANTTNTAGFVPIHEHDPLLVFTPAAADVFEAVARRDGTVDDDNSNVYGMLHG